MAKRGENIYKRRDHRWEGRYIIGRKPDGRARYASVYGKTYHEVKAKLEQRKGQRIRSLPACGLTIKALMETWLALRATKVKLSTYQRYETLIACHILPRLGGVRVSSLTTEILTGYIKDLQRTGRVDGSGGLSDKTVSDIVCILRSAIRLAGKQYAVRDDVLSEVKAPVVYQKRVETLGNAECEILTRCVLAKPDLNGAAYLLALGYGLRLGEICALKWSDIDFTEKELCIKRTVVRIKAGKRTALALQTPKTDSSYRVIPLTDEMLQLFLSLKDVQNDDAYILTGKKSKPQEPRTLQNRFYRFLRDHGLKRHHFHALRHTFATRSIEAGYDAKTVSEILGHRNIKTTLQLYVHPSMTHKRQLVEAISCLPEAI